MISYTRSINACCIIKVENMNIICFPLLYVTHQGEQFSLLLNLNPGTVQYVSYVHHTVLVSTYSIMYHIIQ